MSHFGGGGSGREDCWSEGGTVCLVDAWGDRYVAVKRGNLRQKDWSDVADAVNRRQDLLGRPRKTDVQCKNRIDTVKKKYKLEKSKPGVSPWPHFSKLDLFVGPTPSSSASASATKKLRRSPLAFLARPRNPSPCPNPNPNMAGAGGSSSRPRFLSPLQLSSESSLGENGDDEEEASDDDEDGTDDDRFLKKRKWEGLVECERGRGGDRTLGQLARAIVKFSEVYERVESEKQLQVMELERHRMECAKDLEFQWMKMFMEAQLEMEKMKRPKYGSGSGKRL